MATYGTDGNFVRLKSNSLSFTGSENVNEYKLQSCRRPVRPPPFPSLIWETPIVSGPIQAPGKEVRTKHNLGLEYSQLEQN